MPVLHAPPKRQTELSKAAGNFPTRVPTSICRATTRTTSPRSGARVANPGEPNPAARQVMALLAPEIQAALRGKKSRPKRRSTTAAERTPAAPS